ncbi:oxidoreductase [Prauserella marina]|uniref:Short-chain dehydrogenase n=1 Tax=Prauserella marina TaxID=530584 RepID=A0A222VR39_9PSEU|nr:SDR family NAD(P)-dependent oxidoreductase [Prauserella marina]ASR36369.1 oxidoreductase [Prauserella marina]PWV77166.1 short-subunit dehydrogenase [Prauserella marina]SDD05925.1 Short-chain dehydrogenase [Prauserella marina]
MSPQRRGSLAGKRVLITGAARGIGAALAIRLHARGAKVALAGIEPAQLSTVAGRCDAPWRSCDVRSADQVTSAVGELASELGGLDIVVANAGIAKQLPLVGGDPAVLEQTLRVNVLGSYHTLNAAGPFVAHPGGYVVLVASLAAAVQLPLLGAYSASKAAVEALGNTARIELHATGARVGVAYFAELDTDMTSRGFGTNAATALTGGGSLNTPAPLNVGIDALERGIVARKRRIVAPPWAGAVLPVRGIAQRVIDVATRKKLPAALSLARDEEIAFTTPQPEAES